MKFIYSYYNEILQNTKSLYYNKNEETRIKYFKLKKLPVKNNFKYKFLYYVLQLFKSLLCNITSKL